jgi:uncharacterized protein (DUF1778 family)
MSSNKTLQLNIRIDAGTKQVLAQAARESNRSLSAYLLDVGRLFAATQGLKAAEFPRSARAD